jgi:3D (Asp-Asp-Asp) domain-containing protein
MSRTTLLAVILIILGAGSLGAATYLLLQAEGSHSLAEAVPPTTTGAAVTAVSPQPTTSPEPALTLLPTATLPAASFSVTIMDGQDSRTLQTEAATVNELLSEAGILLGEKDLISPSLGTPLSEDLVIQISRAIPLTVVVDGQTYAIFSSPGTTSAALTQAGISLGELDMVTPALDTPLNAGDTLNVVHVREEVIVFDEQVPYQTIYQPSDELDLDTKAILSSGVPGIKRQSTRIRYEDGVEVSREFEGEWIEQEPVNEVIGYGTRITTNVIDTPEGPREYWRVVHMRVTAYTAASSGKSPDHPSYGITASGRPAGTGIVAVDPNVIPFRSEVYVPGYGVGFAGDTGGGVKGLWIDLGYDEDELQTWNGYTDVYYLTPIPAEINYLLPEVLP